MNSKRRILNIEVLSTSMNTLLSELHAGILFNLNVDDLVKLQKDRSFFNAYNAATHIVVDSQILFLLSKLTSNPLPEKISGSDFLPAYYNHHRSNENIRIFLLGSKNGAAKRAMQNINEKIGRNIVVGAHSPSMGFDTKEEECSEIVHLVNSSRANVLVVGVGRGVQQKWIIKYKSALSKIDLFMALGASIDIEAGVVDRAPRWISFIGFEWMYRLYKEPRRLWRRYLVDDMVFFWLAFKQMIGIYRDPWN